jgi:large subunit ribosomal protein L4e
MKAPVYGIDGTKKGEVNLGRAFVKPLRSDLIKRAVLVERTNARQPYGTDPLAGQRTSAMYKGRRGIRGSMMNREMARMKRITGGGFLRWRARAIPGVVKGRKAHPPKTGKNWTMKMNKKERLRALLSAISGTADRELVERRGHLVDDLKHVPLVLDDKFQELKKNRDVLGALRALGLGDELKRCSGSKVRSGIGKLRGRRKVRRKGPLIVVSEDRGLAKAAGAIPGVDVTTPKELTVSMLAPGTTPGRLTLWTRSAAEAADKLAA